MLKHELLPEEKTLVLYPQEPLSSKDFKAVSKKIEAQEHENLKGLIIEAESFPGWEDFSGFLSHIKFIREHHNRISRVAAVTDSQVIPALQSIGQHFVNPEVKQFDPGEKSKALNWIKQ